MCYAPFQLRFLPLYVAEIFLSLLEEVQRITFRLNLKVWLDNNNNNELFIRHKTHKNSLAHCKIQIIMNCIHLETPQAWNDNNSDWLLAVQLTRSQSGKTNITLIHTHAQSDNEMHSFCSELCSFCSKWVLERKCDFFKSCILLPSYKIIIVDDWELAVTQL